MQAPGPLWLALDRRACTGGRHRDPEARRLGKDGLRDLCDRRAARARIPRFRPHDLRRSFVGDLLAAGVDVVTMRKLAGHASPEVTALYDRRGFATRQAAVARLEIPL